MMVTEFCDAKGEMVIETSAVITTASQDEMIRFIEAQTDEILIKAYREMLQGY